MGSKQIEVPGTERPVNKKVASVMQVLSDKTKGLTRARNARKEAETRAIAVMREEGVDEYVDEDLGLCIKLDELEKVKLSKWEPPKGAKPAPAEAKA